MKKLFKKCIVVLGFVLFFAMFSSIADTHAALAKEISEADIPTETQAEIKLNVKTKALVKDVNYTLKVYNLTENQKVTFKSSAPDIATVDETGVILGISNGVATITVTVREGIRTVASLTCEVTVGPPAIAVKWTKSEVVLVVGKRTTLKTILLPFNTTESAKFYSADDEVVTVNSNGKITGKAIGVTYVFTTIDSGKYDFCKVTVVDEETYQTMLEEAAAVTDIPEMEPAEEAE